MKPQSQILGFLHNEKWVGEGGWILNTIFRLFIIATMANCYISRVIIDDESSYDIMYDEVFEKLRMKKEKLWSYKGFDLLAFNRIETHSWGYIKLMVTLR